MKNVDDLSTDELRQVIREREAKENADVCPGFGACHGCLKWCVVCGDVSETCDDTNCDQHSVCPGCTSIYCDDCHEKPILERPL